MSFPFNLNEFYFVPNDQVYHDLDALSFGQIKDLAVSSKHWDAAKRSKIDSDALRIGRAIHEAVLLPKSFNDRLKIRPNVDARTKEGKALRDDFNASLKDTDLVLSGDEFKMCESMRSELEQNEDWQAIISHADKIEEFSLVEVDLNELMNLGREFKILCKFKPDMILKNGMIVDYKTTQCAHPNYLIGDYKEIRKRKYNAQMAWYSLMRHLVTGEPLINKSILVFQEKEDPYCSTVVTLDENDLNDGLSFLHQGLYNYIKYLDTKKLQGYSYEFDKTILEY